MASNLLLISNTMILFHQGLGAVRVTIPVSVCSIPGGLLCRGKLITKLLHWQEDTAVLIAVEELYGTAHWKVLVGTIRYAII